MKVVKGDLLKLALQGEFDCIVHGCNCFNTFGAGIALQIKQVFPEAWEIDRNTIKGYKAKLGNYTTAKSNGIVVINAYTQFKPGYNDLQENYQAINDSMKKIAIHFQDKKLGMPLIGAGLAGGDWNVIKDIIKNNLEGMVDYTIVKWDK
jgi:O-acetyl-ADP-ribose deacetylase (regulator of RNase III)